MRLRGLPQDREGAAVWSEEVDGEGVLRGSLTGRCLKHCAELEMYVYYGTNEYNFEKLENPPAYEPTHCVGCGRVIALGTEGYEVGPRGYRCEGCFEE